MVEPMYMLLGKSVQHGRVAVLICSSPIIYILDASSLRVSAGERPVSALHAFEKCCREFQRFRA